MLKNILTAFFLCLLAARSSAQIHVSISPAARSKITKDTTRLLPSLDSFSTYKDHEPLSTLSLQLINFYYLEKGRHWVSVACSDSTKLIQIRDFVARRDSGSFSRSLGAQHPLRATVPARR